MKKNNYEQAKRKTWMESPCHKHTISSKCDALLNDHVTNTQSVLNVMLYLTTMSHTHNQF